MKKCDFFNIKIFFFFIINYSLYNCGCAFNTPIYKNNTCQLIYCSEDEFKEDICTIRNDITRIQWLNNIILFNEKKYRYCNFAVSSNGDLIAELSTEENNGIRIFYGLKQNGNFYFQNSNKTKVPTKNVVVENCPMRYESENIFITLNNTKEYLISISLYYGYTELYDLQYNIQSFIKTEDLFNYTIYSTKSQLIEIITNTSEKQYFHIFIGTDKNHRYFNYYLVLNKYSFYDNIINSNIIIKNERISNVFSSRVVSAYKTNNNELIIFYCNNNFKIAIYDSDLIQKFEEKISDKGNINGGTGVFFKCVYLKKNLGIFIYFKDFNDYGPYVKLESIEKIDDEYNMEEKFSIDLNNEGYRFQTEPLLSDCIKLNDNRFSFITSSYDKE